MAANDIHQWDIGTVFTYTVLKADGSPEDLSGLTLADQRLIFRKPSGEALIKVPTWGDAGDGSDGQLRYTSVAGDLNEPGVWYWQPILDGLAAWDGGADIKSFTVHPNLI